MTLLNTVETSLFIVAFGPAGSTAGGQGHHGAQAVRPAPVPAQRMLDDSRMEHTVVDIIPGNPVPRVRLAAQLTHGTDE